MFANGHLAIITLLGESLERGRTEVRLLNPSPNQQKVPDVPLMFKSDSHIDTEELDLNNSHADEISDLETAVDLGSVIAGSVPMRFAGAHSSSSDQNSRARPTSRTLSNHSNSDPRRGMGATAVDSLIEDPTLYFDDITPREVLDELIARLRDQVEHDHGLDHFHQAAEHLQDLILLLEELYIGYGEPFTDFYDMQNQLATIYSKQGKEDEAKKVLHASLQHKSEPGETSVVKAPTMVDAGVILDKAKPYLNLGQMHREEYQSNKNLLYLDAAERDAKRGFKCSLKSREDESFVQAVTLLIQVYEDKGKMVHADTYPNLFLPPVSDHKSPTSSNADIRKDSSLESLDLVDMIIQGRFDRDVNLPTGMDLEICRDGKTAMMYAVERGDVYAIRKLRQAGAQLDRALFHAIQEGKADMTEELLKLDVPKEVKDCQGVTPLLAAAKSGHIPVMQRLLDGGADANAKDDEGCSVIHLAAHKESSTMMQILFAATERCAQAFEHNIIFRTSLAPGDNLRH